MGLRFRRSVSIMPGVRLNFTKTGLGMTVGRRGLHYSVHSSGMRTTSIGLPGTGIYYQSRTGGGRRGRASRPGGGGSQAPSPQPAGPPRPASVLAAIPKPGLFASSTERAYHAGVVANLGGDMATAMARFEEVLQADASITSAHIFAGFAANTLGDTSRAAAHLEAVVSSTLPFPDHLAVRYLGNPWLTPQLSVRITHALAVAVPFSQLGAALGLAEVYQATGRLSEAIGVVQQIHAAVPNPIVRLSLCDLLFAEKDYDGVVEASTGVENGSDVELETIHLRASSFVALGLDTAAMDAFAIALSKRAGRDPELLTAIRYDRAIALQKAGQHARARADFERVYAADPTFEDVRAQLATLTGSNPDAATPSTGGPGGGPGIGPVSGAG